VCAGGNEVSTLMNIPEILDCLDEPDLEDWLTAAFIENESRLPLDRLCTDGAYPFPSHYSRHLDAGNHTPDRKILEGQV